MKAWGARRRKLRSEARTPQGPDGRYPPGVTSTWRSAALALVLVLPTLGTDARAQAPAPKDSATDERARWTELAARCGEELAWAKDWEEAVARAKAERKAVLAVAWLYPGFDIPDASRTVFAMDSDVIELVNARCVPLALTADSAVPFAAEERYGLPPTAFGAALLLVTPDGEVLADTPHWQPAAAYDFLWSMLAAHPEFAGAERPRRLSDEERVTWHLARGEFSEASACVAELASARGYLLKARLLRLAHKLELALAAVAHARELERQAGEHPGRIPEAELDREELVLELARGHVGPARVLCERLVRADPARPEALEAAHLLGVLDFFAGERAEAERRWRALVAEHPESRWAVEAATALLAPEIQLGDFMLERASPELLESLADVPFSNPAPFANSAPFARPSKTEANRAIAGALGWLAAERRDDGSWIDPSELEGGPSAANSISVAVDVLAARALLAHRAHRPVDLERETSLALAAARASLAARSSTPTYMTYEVWSDALALERVVDLLEAGAGSTADKGAELRALGRDLARALAARQRTNGGWSYFQAATLEASAAKLEQSISFVTATVVLALTRALEAGVELDEEVLEHGLDALEAMRSSAGAFAYMLWSFQKRAPDEGKPAEAAGRAPLCELALLRGGRSDMKRMHAAVEQFFEHSAALAREVGKALMHSGTEGQGCHYVLYDYATAARAIAALPAAEQKPYRARLLALLDATRRTDGAFFDTPVLGPASGTALALLAFAELGADE